MSTKKGQVQAWLHTDYVLKVLPWENNQHAVIDEFLCVVAGCALETIYVCINPLGTVKAQCEPWDVSSQLYWSQQATLLQTNWLIVNDRPRLIFLYSVHQDFVLLLQRLCSFHAAANWAFSVCRNMTFVHKWKTTVEWVILNYFHGNTLLTFTWWDFLHQYTRIKMPMIRIPITL